ncbi:MAG: hypothetical protein NDP22_01205 [Crenarchaeota archaeon]|nr:hypothetical protein [Thermoproteota archaeon]
MKTLKDESGDIESLITTLQEKIREEAQKFILEDATMKILKYIKLLKKDFRVLPGLGLVIEEKAQDLTVPIYIIFRPPEWIEMKTLLASGKELPSNLANQCGVYEILLKLANDFAELSFSIDKEENLYARQNILVGALSFDAFKEEYDALVLSAVIFRKELLKKFKACVRKYEEFKKTFESELT